MIGVIVTFHTKIQGNKLNGKIVPSVQKNQIKIHNTKDTGVINQIFIMVSYTCNEKVKSFSLNLRENMHKMLACYINISLILYTSRVGYQFVYHQMVLITFTKKTKNSRN